MTTYKSSGVDVELGNDVSKIFYNAARQTWKNRKGKLGEVLVPNDDFSGLRFIDVSNLPKGTVMNIGFDGVGTKVELAERTGNHRTIAFDLFAMVCDDAVVRGAEPVLIGSVLDVNSLGNEEKKYVDEIGQLASGYIISAKHANVAVINGEIAELGARVSSHGSFNYNWSAAVVWFANKERMFTGTEIKVGDYLIGLRETGFRSNGLSLVRKIMQEKNGKNWHRKFFQYDKTLGELSLTPSRIYTGAIVDMFGGYDLEREPRAEIHGVAHITGGGIPEKLGRVLRPSGFGALIEDLFNPPEIMSYTQRLGKVSDEEAYSTWNMGQGMVVISPEPDEVIRVSNEKGIDAKVIGVVKKDSGITIISKGEITLGKKLIFNK